MIVNPDFFQDKGVPYEVKGNSPLPVNDPQKVWLVEKGAVDLFFTRLEGGLPEGKRYFVGQMEEGALIFGVSPLEKGYGLLAIGSIGTLVREVEFSSLLILLKDKPKDLATLIRKWLEAFGKLHKGKDDLEENPLEALGRLQVSLLEDLLEYKISQNRADAEGLRGRRLINRQFMQSALGELANSLTKKKQLKYLTTVVSTDPLVQTLSIVCEYSRIPVTIPDSLEQGNKRDVLDQVARASGFRYRRVALKDNWWEQDQGALLAYIEEDGRPVSLIPVQPGRYKLYDVADGSKGQLVTSEVADGLQSFGIMVYRPFDNKPISARELLIFGLENTWKRDLAFLVLMGLMGGLLNIFIPVATGLIFDNVIPAGDASQLFYVFLILAAAAVAGLLFQITRSIALLRIQGKMDGSIQAAIWDRLLSLPVPFYKNHEAGDLAMRAMGISQIRDILAGTVTTSLLAGIFSIFNFVLLFVYDYKLAGVATVLGILSTLIVLFLGLLQMRHERRLIDVYNKLSGKVLQLINGIPKFKSAGAESRAFFQWANDYKEAAVVALKKDRLANVLTTYNSVFPIISSGIIFYFLLRVIDNEMAAGNFIAFNAAYMSFVLAMTQMSESLLSINTIIPVYNRLKPILAELPEFDEAKSDPGLIEGSIEVSNVSFRYTADGPLILNNLSLQIREGEYVGVVGPSGCGKSTLFRVLLGFERPETGTVFYDGKDLFNVDVRAVRKQLGVVLQNGKVMSGDIYSNIVGANLNFVLNDAWEAAAMAGLDKDIREMPMGMHTVVSEGATTLSGGQRQRLLIARAIVNRPKILLFDEATSALDNKTQAIVSESLKNLRATRVVIAHRFSTIADCDRIIVMDKGQIVEEGSPNELLARDGVFAQLAKRQLA